MSNLTPNDIRGLMEAYTAVHAPQEELTEEQVWEEVETWVNSLVEEGYDLSDYTWEEMYEAYLSEMGQTRTTGQNSSGFMKPPTPSAGSAGGSGSGGRRGSGMDRNSFQTSSSPGALRVQPTFQNTGGFGRYAPPSMQQRTPAPTAPARPAAPVAQRPAARPATPPTAKSAPSQRVIGDGSAAGKPSAAPSTTTTAFNLAKQGVDLSKPSTPAPTPPAKPEQALSKLSGGNYSGDATKLMSQRTKNILGTTKTPATRLGGARERMLNQDLDLFDVIKGHLLDEGYADTEEAALAIMANMSEDWKQSIVEEYKDFPTAKVMKKAGNLMSSSAGKTDAKSNKKKKRGIKMMDTMMQHKPD